MKKYYFALFAIFNPNLVYAEGMVSGAGSSLASKILNFGFVFFSILSAFLIMGMIVNSKMGIESRQKRQLISSIFNGIGVVVGAIFAKNQFL